MKALIWKELRENLKWAVLPVLLTAGIYVLGGTPNQTKILKADVLIVQSLIAAVFGAALGFLQIFAESSGDRRALLLHRPISRSRIFLAKAAAGASLYLLALGIPFAWVVAWNATPGHNAAPFTWPMALPWLADVLTGLVYYFAGMLLAQREARWYGSRGLGVAAAFLCSFLVWSMPEFWHALVVIAVMGTVLALAAWGSFLTGGAYAPLAPVARIALAATFVTGLLTVGVTVKALIAAWCESSTRQQHTLDREGRLLVVRYDRGAIESVTDLDGHEAPQLKDKTLETSALREIEAPLSGSVWPAFRSYRNPGRYAVPYYNSTSSADERWHYVPAEGRLLGYDARTKRHIGSIGPDGFVPAGQPATERFTGDLYHMTFLFDAGGASLLNLSGRVYTVDFGARTLRTLFTPALDETVLGAFLWREDKTKTNEVFVFTDKAVHLLAESGAPLFSAPLVYDRETYGVVRLARLENPKRYAVWYEPSWHLRTQAGGKSMPGYLVEYEVAAAPGASGERRVWPEIARRTMPPRPLPVPSYAQAAFGVGTAPAEAGLLVGGAEALVWHAKLDGGTEIGPLLLFLVFISQSFIPGTGWDVGSDDGVVLAFGAATFLTALASALVCLLVARRYAFSGPRLIGWSVSGFVFGPAGLLLMLALQEFPARVRCPACHQWRVVDRADCEHCGAAHALPARDGTEIFEEPAVAAPCGLAS